MQLDFQIIAQISINLNYLKIVCIELTFINKIFSEHNLIKKFCFLCIMIFSVWTCHNPMSLLNLKEYVADILKLSCKLQIFFKYNLKAIIFLESFLS